MDTWVCTNGHEWQSEEIESELFRLEGELGAFTVAGIDPSVCPLDGLTMGCRWDGYFTPTPQPTMPRVEVMVR